ncbi:hypothetical protein [Micromonospora sp. NPDC004704]
MPAGDDTEQPYRRQLLTVLFWVGVGLAPLAALMLLFGQSNGPLRIAAVLAVLAVVLIGLSITLRGDMQTVRSELEETLLEEIEELRGVLRQDIGTANRATHQSVGEQLQVVQQNVEALRRQLDARADAVPGRAGVPVAGAVRSGSAPAAAGPAVEPERREPAREGVYGAPSRPAVERAAPTPPRPERDGRAGPAGREQDFDPGDFGRADPRRAEGASQYGNPQRGPAQYGGSQYGPGQQYGGGQYPAGEPEPGYGGDRGGGRGASAPAGGAGPAHRPHLAGGVVRHTETVKVTTRQTIVGPPGDDGGAGSVYGGTGYDSGSAYPSGAGYPPGNAYGGRGDDREDDWSEQPARGRRRAGPDEDSWSDQWPRDRGDGGARRAGRYDRDEPDDPGYEGDPHWSGGAGDRWASVRRDERGSELRMGERRAAVRADDSGTEMRVEDRWASMRRDEPRRADARRDEPQREEAWRARSGREDSWRGEQQRAESWRDEPGGRRAGDDRSPGGSGGRTGDDRASGGRRRADEWSGSGSRGDAGGAPWPGSTGAGSGDAYRPGSGGSGDAHWPGADAGAWSGGGQDRWGGAPALPAGNVDPSSSRRGGWDSAAREPAGPGRRRAEEPAYGYPPDDDVPRAGGTRRR